MKIMNNSFLIPTCFGIIKNFMCVYISATGSDQLVNETWTL